MSYQALARKWRPRQFAEVIGQGHVVNALKNALDLDRVHHAFLFTGTRGIGKTTIARIFAKALNCEHGVSSEPCGSCSACTSIDQGRFIDLIEVDAASRTKVDDTRELLDNVQYVPTMGRFKVYLIDEVHMLSGHSFNALLKTLEEPPEHVKFLLATTDPQKLPVTVLSRCLQFHLKPISIDKISAQLKSIADQESLSTEAKATRLLAMMASGSMRDGLSLLDQAAAFGNGEVTASNIESMLGTLGSEQFNQIFEALADQDAIQLLKLVHQLANDGIDFLSVLDQLIEQLSHLILQQHVPEALDAKQLREPWHANMAKRFSVELLQLYYQIALEGKKDVSLAPDLRTGFEVLMLRLLAFTPHQPESGKPPPADKNTTIRQPAVVKSAPKQPVESAVAQVDIVVVNNATSAAIPQNNPQWEALIPALSLKGLVREVAMHLSLNKTTDSKLSFNLDPTFENLYSSERVKELSEVISTHFKQVLEVIVEIKSGEQISPAVKHARQEAEKRQQQVKAVYNDPNVQQLVDRFDATIIDSTIQSKQDKR